MLHISYLPFPKSWCDKTSFFPSVLEKFLFLLIIICPNGEGIYVTEGSGIPHGNSRLESLTMESKFLREVEEYASECLLFWHIYKMAAMTGHSKIFVLCFIFDFLSVWLWIAQTACWNWTTVSLRFFSSSVLQVSFMLTVLLHHLSSIFFL